MSIISAIRNSATPLTDASRPLARIWRNIEDSLDGDTASLINNDRLSWIPAHLSIRAVGEMRLPDGNRLTMTDWRANRLVDILAKAGAKCVAPSSDVQKLLSSATALAKHFAAQLGEVAFVANNFRSETIGLEGEHIFKISRELREAKVH